jgi:hypothetical protein
MTCGGILSESSQSSMADTMNEPNTQMRRIASTWGKRPHPHPPLPRPRDASNSPNSSFKHSPAHPDPPAHVDALPQQTVLHVPRAAASAGKTLGNSLARVFTWSGAGTQPLSSDRVANGIRERPWGHGHGCVGALLDGGGE